MSGQVAGRALSIGADPEVICFQEGVPVSAIGLLPGDKGSPFPLTMGSCHPDNVMAEFQANPSSSRQEFNTTITSNLADVASLVEPCTIGRGMVASYPPEQLGHPDAKVSGCNPDFSAWFYGAANPSPEFRTGMRCAGGHIHIGYEITDPLKFIQCCDLYLSIPAMKVEDPSRRELYGKAGCFRQKPYGVEYRTFGNHWIWEEATRLWVWDQVERICQVYESIVLPEELPEIINNHDLVEAEELMRQFDLVVYPGGGHV